MAKRSISGYLKNMGPVSGLWLREVGVSTLGDLQNIGIEEAYRMMVARGFNVNALMLYGMEGALTDTHWNEIPDERKAELRRISERIKEQQKLTK